MEQGIRLRPHLKKGEYSILSLDNIAIELEKRNKSSIVKDNTAVVRIRREEVVKK